MAGDWFPMQLWRSRCPEVVLISSLSGRDRHETLGWLCDLWSWCSSETTDGRIVGVRVADLPSVLGADARFWGAVEAALWLAEDEGGIVIPGWDNWLCESAKKRAKERQKKRNQRSRPRPKLVPQVSPKCPRNVPPTEQNRTEQKREERPTPLPPVPGGEAEESVAAVEFVDLNLWPEFVREWDAAGLPGAGKIQRTPGRVGLLQQRLAADDWRGRWREAVRRAGRSAKCRGLDPTWSSGLRLDTFLKQPDFVVRILEGEFDDAPAGAPAAGGKTKRELELDAVFAEEARRRAG